MKSIAIFLVCLLFCLAGCQPSEEGKALKSWMEQNGKIKVLSTTAIIDNLVKEIGGDRVDSLSLMKGDMDPHSYELVKGDDEKFSFAKLVFSNGLGLEHSASIQTQISCHSASVAIGDEIQKSFPDSIISINGEKDPHIWMDLSLWKEAVLVVKEALITHDPDGLLYYQKKSEELYKKMNALDCEIAKKMSEINPGKRCLVTTHDAFNYFAKRYLAQGSNWQEHFTSPEGLSPEGQLGPLDLQRIVDFLIDHNVPVVFAESNVNCDSLKKIVSVCREKGHEVSLSHDVLYGDVLGPIGSGAETYLDMVQCNADTLLRLWNE